MITTTRQADAVKATDKTQMLALGDSVFLKVTPADARSIVVRYRPVAGENPVTVTICAFDRDTPARLSLADAKARARAVVVNKVLPIGREKKAEAAAVAPALMTAGTTFDALCDRYVAVRRAEPNMAPRSLANIEYNLKGARQAFGATSVEAIENHHLNQLLDGVLIAGTPAAMTAIRSTLRCLFHWARLTLGKKVIQVDLTDFRKPAPRQVASKVLTDDELRALNAARLSVEVAAIARLQILTGLRAGEAAGLRWSEIVGDEIVIPGERMKMRVEHRLPIVAAIREVLDAAKARGGMGDSVFARDAGTYKNAISGLGLGFSSHDLRRTFRTRLGLAGVAHEVAEELLAHAVHTGVQKSYNHHRASHVAKAAALNGWHAELASILGGKANVLPLRKSA